jgi:hypothetical protein
MLNILFEKTDRSIAAQWKSRLDRNRFVKSIAESRACKQILNVGSGGKRELAKIVNSNTTVFDLDMWGDCDLTLNLDSIEALPFGDGEFEMVCAMDVLEHLESFHLINDELFRVSSRCVLISLPNSAAELFQVALGRRELGPENERGFFSKYYGLTLKKPPDRHRWWLYPQDIVRFYEAFAVARSCKVTYFIPRPSFSSSIARLVMGKHLHSTFFIPHIAVLLEKHP